MSIGSVVLIALGGIGGLLLVGFTILMAIGWRRERKRLDTIRHQVEEIKHHHGCQQ